MRNRDDTKNGKQNLHSDNLFIFFFWVIHTKVHMGAAMSLCANAISMSVIAVTQNKDDI